MYVVKRNGEKQSIQYDKITKRMQHLLDKQNIIGCDVVLVTKEVVSGVTNGMTTEEVDLLASKTAISLGSLDYRYAQLAGLIVIDNLHKKTNASFSKTIFELHAQGLIHDKMNQDVATNASVLDLMIRHDLDFELEYFAFKTLEKTYLLRCKDKILERPQYVFMRVAVALHGTDLQKIKETYDLLSHRIYTHATPTLFNAGTPWGYLSSCFLLQMEEDSIKGINSTLGKCAEISKSEGGIALTI